MQSEARIPGSIADDRIMTQEEISMKGMFSNHIELTGKVLDLRMKRQNVVMSNLANIDTPNYKPLEIEWEGQLQSALNNDAKGKMARTKSDHMPSVFNPETFGADFQKAFQPHEVPGDDSVDMDKEMAKLSKNTLMYNALTTIIKKNFEGMKTVIREGKS